MNKVIHRDVQSASAIFDNRSVEVDYRTLLPILKNGLRVLDVGCGTGAISKGIADRVGETGYVIGIDHTESFIASGKATYKNTKNLELIHADIFSFEPEEKFDLIVAARVLQWLSNPKDALRKLKSMLKPGGQISILDYNHTNLEWQPSPPESMLSFYKIWLGWRSDAGMNNSIAEDLSSYLEEVGFKAVEVFNSNETYTKGNENFNSKVGIWAKVAESSQLVEEGYLGNIERLEAIDEYNNWISNHAESMVMKLNEVRGRN